MLCSLFANRSLPFLSLLSPPCLLPPVHLALPLPTCCVMSSAEHPSLWGISAWESWKARCQLVTPPAVSDELIHSSCPLTIARVYLNDYWCVLSDFVPMPGEGQAKVHTLYLWIPGSPFIVRRSKRWSLIRTNALFFFFHLWKILTHYQLAVLINLWSFN